MEELNSIEAAGVKEKCPAFKEGCPFVKVEDKKLMEAIEKCPDFKEGCPFKYAKKLSDVYKKLSQVPHAAGHEYELSGQKLVEMLKKIHYTSECLEEQLGDCPVFHTDQGCPFKSVQSGEEKHLVEPVESVWHSQRVVEELKQVDATHLKEQYPAFKDGCPLTQVENKQLIEAIEKCPEFKEGCPFKDAKRLSEVYEKLSHVPPAAGLEGESSGEKLVEIPKKMHDSSECLEVKPGDCLVFHKDQGCPFKNVRNEEGKHLVEPVEAVGHDQHIIEELKSVDASNVKGKCPAFKEGCPFAKVEEKPLIEAIEKCPEFKEGCPFKDAASLAEVYEKLSRVPHAAGHENEFPGKKLVEMFQKMHDTSECLEEKLGDCPVFHKDRGCPFKSVRDEEGKHLVEPVESVTSGIRNCGPPSPSKKKIMIAEVTTIKETCPAFQPSCPFSKVDQTAGAFIDVMKCPAFKDGCAFKGCRNIRDIYVKLQEIPNLDQEKGSHWEVLGSLKMVHEICIDLENELGECPLFKTAMGCPFKTVCSDGKLMLEKLESYLTSRALSEATESAKESIEQELISTSRLILSTELKGGTKKIHRMAENTFFVKQLLKGKVTPAAYKLLLSNLFFVYRTIEEESEKNKSHPKLGATYFPRELNRTAEIIKDLEFFYGNDWKDEIEPVNTTKRYTARLRKLSAEDPLMLLAHQYTRYMGDLSGGQVIKRILMKALNLSDDGGLKFYEFEHVQNKKTFKDKYRSSLDALQLDKDTADRLVEESIKSFELNIELFDELGVLCGYIPEDFDTVNEMSSKPSKKEAPEVKPSTEKCPFAIGQITTTQRKSAVATTGTSTPEVGTRAGIHRGKSSGGNLVIILGVSVAMFAMLYAYLLA